MQLPVARGRERHPIVTGVFILLGVLFSQVFLILLLSGPVSNGITASGSDTDPFFVLVTPSSGARAGKMLYVMDWDDRDFEAQSAVTGKVAQKVELEPEWDGQDTEFRLASPTEIQRLHLPYDHKFHTDDGMTEITITESDAAITVRRSTGNRSRVCTYSPDASGPNFQH